MRPQDPHRRLLPRRVQQASDAPQLAAAGGPGQAPGQAPGTAIVYADRFGPVMDMMESPAKFGLEEDALLTPCCGGPDTLLCGEDGGNLCENPSARLFWDGAHPTEAAYHYMAHLLLRSIDDTTVRGASYTSL
uniref:GDSL esterase/lipase n=2 Tax=Aegilops tauschii subsp. strangulata TaxID=200361 RepID=A0A453L8D3_AEGTS